MAREEEKPASVGEFSFLGGDEGYEALKRRRAIAAALASRQRGFPKTLGEGLTYFGESLGEAIGDWRLRQMEARQKGLDTGVVTGAPETTYVPRATPVPPPAAPPPVPASPAEPPPEPPPAPDASVFPDPPPAPVAAVEPPPDLEPPPLVSRPPNVMPGARGARTASFMRPPEPDTAPDEPYLPPASPPSPLNERAAALSAGPQPLPPEPPGDIPQAVAPQTVDMPMPRPRPPGADMMAMPRPRPAEADMMPMPRPRPEGDLPAQAAMSPPRGMGGNVQSWYDFSTRPREQGGLGLSHAQAAAKIANLQAESGQNIAPWGVVGDKGTAFGAAQWRGPRFAALQQFAAQRGLDHRTTEAQQAFMRHEYDTTEKRAYQRLLATQTPEAAATAINRFYERSADTTGRREQNAARLAGMLGQGGGAPSVASAAPPEADPATVLQGPSRVPEAAIPDQRDLITAALMEQQPQPPPGGVAPQQEGASPGDVRSEALLRETMGMRRPGSPFRATASRGDIGTDAPLPGLSPLGSATGAGVSDSIQQRQRIYDAVQQQQGPVVPPADPTLAAGTPPQPTSPTGTGSDPTRLAQALPPGIRPDAGGIWPPVGGAVAPPPATPTDIRPAPAMPPSREAIPPASAETYPDPGPEPKRPPQLGPSPAQQYWMRHLNNPNVSDAVKAHALRKYNEEETYRKELQTRADNDYIDKREAWQAATLAKQKHEREAPTREIDQLTKRLGIEKEQAAIAKTPYELQQAQLAVQKTQIEIAQARRNLVKPETFESGGARYEQPHDASGRPTGPYTLAPGSPPPKEEMTADQASAQQFVSRVKPDLKALDTELRHGAVLTVPSERLRDLPGVGNYTVTDEYRRAKAIMTNFEGAFMQRVSGAAVSESEGRRNMPAFMPAVGDTPQDLADKAERRNRFVDAVEASAGPAGKAAIHRVLAESSEYLYQKAGEKPPVKVKTTEEADALDPGTRIIRPDGKEGRVPRKGF